jgi:hypothetical protein
MDAVQPILPFLGWIVLVMVTGVGAMGVYLMHNFLDRITKLFETSINHEGRIITLEVIEGIDRKK